MGRRRRLCPRDAGVRFPEANVATGSCRVTDSSPSRIGIRRIPSARSFRASLADFVYRAFHIVPPGRPKLSPPADNLPVIYFASRSPQSLRSDWNSCAMPAVGLPPPTRTLSSADRTLEVRIKERTPANRIRPQTNFIWTHESAGSSRRRRIASRMSRENRRTLRNRTIHRLTAIGSGPASKTQKHWNYRIMAVPPSNSDYP
jgi:hypothetical protein